MALILPGTTQPNEEPEQVPTDNPNFRSFSDLEDFCKHMRIYGQSGDLTIWVEDIDGNTYGVIGFDVSIGSIKIGKAPFHAA